MSLLCVGSVFQVGLNDLSQPIVEETKRMMILVCFGGVYHSGDRVSEF
jgi:hypothetical protein